MSWAPTASAVGNLLLEGGKNRPAGSRRVLLIQEDIGEEVPYLLQAQNKRFGAPGGGGRYSQLPSPERHSERMILSRDPSQFGSVAQSRSTLCDPMDCSTPDLPVHHQLLEFTQTHVH